jgi:hypothetical protein
VSSQFVREATRDGRPVALLRCYDASSGGAVVDAQVMPVDGGAEPIRRGPYWFSNANEALRFLQEAVLALQYLGCTVGETPS